MKRETSGAAVVISESTTDIHHLSTQLLSDFAQPSQHLCWPSSEIYTFITHKPELLWLLYPIQVMVSINAHSWLLLNLEVKQAPQGIL